MTEQEQSEESALAFRASIGRCEWCQARSDGLVVHEIARGGGVRLKARQADYARICVCQLCHDILHAMGIPAVPCGLAILMYGRPKDFDLTAYWKLMGRDWPDFELVRKWGVRLNLE